MPRRVVNLTLLALVFVLLLTGLLGWVLPLREAAPLLDLHRFSGVALLVLLVWKEGIARVSLRRRVRSGRAITVIPGLLGAVALVSSMLLGVAWTVGLVGLGTFWGYSALNVHVIAGVVLAPIGAWHAVRRVERNVAGARPFSRRDLLRLAGGAVASLVLWRLFEEAAAARVAGRRVTGSRHVGSFSGNDFPLTQWAFDPILQVDAGSWRLTVSGRVDAPGAISYADLERLPRRELDAILDCTGGWWSEQRWSGFGVRDVLAARGLQAGAGWCGVRSVTGHSWSFRLEDLDDALLATHVGDAVLSAGHGYPVRLVVPGRRGFQWVKWVARLDVR